jgi:hypothetical protein
MTLGMLLAFVLGVLTVALPGVQLVLWVREVRRELEGHVQSLERATDELSIKQRMTE